MSSLTTCYPYVARQWTAPLGLQDLTALNRGPFGLSAKCSLQVYRVQSSVQIGCVQRLVVLISRGHLLAKRERYCVRKSLPAADSSLLKHTKSILRLFLASKCDAPNDLERSGTLEWCIHCVPGILSELLLNGSCCLHFGNKIRGPELLRFLIPGKLISPIWP